MNERIQELMGKALDQEFSHTWTFLNYQDLEVFTKHFAELIIQECAEIALREDHDPHECILKHFGVK
jgi:hypothetical protein